MGRAGRPLSPGGLVPQGLHDRLASLLSEGNERGKVAPARFAAHAALMPAALARKLFSTRNFRTCHACFLSVY